MTYLRTIRLADTDAAGVVYFAHLLSICHEAYEASLETFGISLQSFLTDPSLAIPIIHGEIDFFRPLFCGDQLRINLQVELISDNQFEVTYRIQSLEQLSTTFARAKTCHVAINPITRQRVTLPESIQNWLRENR